MPQLVESPPETIAERSARATRTLCMAVGLDAVPAKDLKFLTVALAEAAAQEAETNEAFAAHIREGFGKLRGEKPTGRKRGGPIVLDTLKPLRPSELGRLNPFGTLDPYALMDVYGDAQTLQVLNSMQLDELKKTSAIVEERNPGTVPANRRAKKAYVDYIMQHIAPHT